MRVHHQAAGPLEIAAGERIGHHGGTPVLGNHVRRAPDIDGIQRRRDLCQQRVVGVAQRADPRVPRLQRRDHTLAGCATVVVGARRQLPADAAVEDENPGRVRDRHVASLERATVNQERAAFARRRDGQLIHDAAGDARKLVFGPLRQPCRALRIPVHDRRWP